MKRSVIWVALALVGIAVAAWGGYWWGLKQIDKSLTETSTGTAASATKKILYYRNPTQVGRMRILRRLREPGRRNSAN